LHDAEEEGEDEGVRRSARTEDKGREESDGRK
jgi:hypothetical protein